MTIKRYITLKSLNLIKKNYRSIFNWSSGAVPEDEALLRSIFAAASQQFVKSVGHRTLKPVASINDKDNIKPYQLVVKATKRRFIFFEKAFYYPTEFQLSDVMTDASPLTTRLTQSTLISEFNKQTKLALKGKIGADITKNILAVELATKDSVKVNIEFDDVNKLEAHEPQLMKELSSRCIDLDHPYIQQIRRDPDKMLCLVSGVASLNTGGAIQKELEVGGSATLKASLIKKASVSGGATYNRNRDIGLAPGTPVAYSVHELAVDGSTGTMQLVLAVGSFGGFVEGLGTPAKQTAQTTQSVQTTGKQDLDVRHPSLVFQPLLQLPVDQRARLTTDLLYLMSVPRDLVILDTMIDAVESGSVTSLSLDEIEKKLLSPSDRWLGVLQLAGFKIDGDTVSVPDTGSPQLQCVGEFLDAVTELEDDDVSLLRLCSEDNARLLCKVIEECMRGGQVTDASITAPLLADQVATQILQQLNFRVTNTHIVPPTSLPFNIDEIFWVLFALWGKA